MVWTNLEMSRSNRAEELNITECILVRGARKFNLESSSYTVLGKQDSTLLNSNDFNSDSNAKVVADPCIDFVRTSSLAPENPFSPILAPMSSE